MPHIVNDKDPGKERRLLCRAVVVAIRYFSHQKEHNTDSHDLIVFIILSLETVIKTVDRTVFAWEKRDYWMKADRFRLEWSWVELYSKELRIAYSSQNWRSIEEIIANIGKKLVGVKVSENNRIGTPWKGFKDHFK